MDLLGLCQRAGKVLSGDCLVKSKIKSKKAKLVLLATDASSRTKKEYLYLVQVNNISMIEVSTKIELGRAIGKSPRAAVAIIDDGFAKVIDKLIQKKWIFRKEIRMKVNMLI